MLIVGGAGSIGSATLRALLRWSPASIHVIDQNENGLAELARDLRSSGLGPSALDLRLMPLDCGAPVAHRFILDGGPYDVVMHFAALKHVRSEKDLTSILQMLDTNVLKQARVMRWLSEAAPPLRYFAVSTDKAADPASFMGASKRLMEHVVFTDAVSSLGESRKHSARFANVAFSAGSLLESWGERLKRAQPIAVPEDTRRFFVSVEEAAEICLLAMSCLPDRHLGIPFLNAEADARELQPIAEAYVEAAGYRPVLYREADEARAAMNRDIALGGWPILVTPRDTDGEKAVEKFVGSDEVEIQVPEVQALRAVRQDGADPTALGALLDRLNHLVTDPAAPCGKSDLRELIAGLVPEFSPVWKGRSLDSRM